MDARTRLQTELERENFVDLLVNNLNAVRDNFGIEAFAYFLDKNNDNHATGRLFYKVDRAGSNPNNGDQMDLVKLANKDIPVSQATVQHVMGRMDMCNNGAEARVVLGEIAEMLNRDPRFDALMQDFETRFPGQSQPLRDFVLGQAAFRLVDACSERVQQQVKADYQVLEDQVKQIKKDNDGGKISKKDQARIDALEAQEKPFVKLMRAGDALLGMIRKDAVLDYRHNYDAGACDAQEGRYHAKVQQDLREKIAAESDMSRWENKEGPNKAKTAPGRVESSSPPRSPLVKLFHRDKSKSVPEQAKEFGKALEEGPTIKVGDTVSVTKMTREEYEAKKRSHVGEMPQEPQGKNDSNDAKKSPGQTKK